jgi:glycine betaine/choline ABC-type transport system substrate-binding protein
METTTLFSKQPTNSLANAANPLWGGVPGGRGGSKMWNRSLYFFIALLLPLSGCGSTADSKIVVGSKNFTESLILGELIAQEVEANTKLQVERKFNLGGFVAHQGLLSGAIDIYPEYTGTAYSALLKLPPLKDSKQVYQKVQQNYNQKFKLEWTEPFGFNNTFALIVRGEDARNYKLKTLSQAAQQTPNWKIAVGYEFLDREDGYKGLVKTYGLKFAAPPVGMDLNLVYRALKDKQVDMAVGNSTEGVLSKLDLVILEDDKRYFPPYDAAPVVRQATLTQHPELRPVLKNLGGKLSEKQMQQLNEQVDQQKKPVAQVVKEFRQSKKL